MKNLVNGQSSLITNHHIFDYFYQYAKAFSNCADNKSAYLAKNPNQLGI